MSTISFVGQSGYATTSGTVPTHVVGDLIVITAYRTALTAPSLPTGYTAIDNTSANANSIRVGYKYATSTSDTSGTWTNATGIIITVYRGVAAIGVVDATTHAAATTVSLASLATFKNGNGKGWVVACYGSTAASTGVATGFTSRGSETITGGNIQVTDKANSTSFASTTCTNATSTVSASVTFEMIQTDSFSTLTDPMTATSLNSTLWNTTVAGSGTFTYSSAGVSENLPSASTSASEAFMSSNNYFDLTGTNTFFHVTGITASATAADNTFDIIDLSNNNGMSFQVESGVLYAQKIVAGTETNITSSTFNATTMAWWRFRELSGTLYWEYATTPTGTWTTMTSLANPFLGGIVTCFAQHILATCYENETNPGSFTFNSYNTLPSTVPTNLFFY